MIDIQVISGTDRPGSNALRISNYLAKKFNQLDMELEAGVISMKDFPLSEVQDGTYNSDKEAIQTFNEPVLSADGLVIVVPEYNGGFPGILKLFIDYLPFPKALEKVPICLVGESDGAFGALRAVEQLQMVIGYRYAYQFPERVFINRVSSRFDDHTGIKDEFQNKLLNSMVPNFAKFVASLKQAGLIRLKMLDD